ncbi:DUF459 domain-containing protein [Pseudomonas putida]|uniref:SGNH/GDSL hydrolase family protein n=1 Tax=Pseudomonas putida TaxID=303 RepID=UPI00370A1F58
MPVSESTTVGGSLRGALKTLLMLLVTMVILCWLNQDSMRLYCQQKYHRSCELPGLSENPAWRLGADITRALGQGRDAFVAELSKPPGDAERVPSDPVVQLPAAVAAVTVMAGAAEAPVYIPPVEAPVQPQPVTPQAPVAAPSVSSSIPPVPARPMSARQVILEPGDEVFFVGDSLMQGVAPHLANTLLKRFNIKSINLSKQSTGLAYPGFFNWPQTVHETLQAHRNIRLMVVFLGPNDPWDMPESRGKPFLRFKSEAWEALYRQRVQSILEQARQYNARVIWVGPPNMNTPRLSTAMQYLREVYRSEALQYQQFYLSANDVFGYGADEFSFYMTDETGKKSKIRGDDGIHFTPLGQRLIANKVLSLIDVHQPGLSER